MNLFDKDTEAFYAKVLQILNDNKIPVLLGGTIAVMKYTGINRPTKDLDIFCKAGDYLKIIGIMQKHGLKTEITDARWIAKIFHKGIYVDLIFGTSEGLWHVEERWFKNAPPTNIFGIKAKLIPPVELIWSKAYVQDRSHYDGADIHHLILKLGKELDWKKLLSRMEIHWEILLAHLINFRFVYPSDREKVPKWIMHELINRLNLQLTTPIPQQKVCRGPLISRNQYMIDVEEWGYQDFHNPTQI
ncbi:nucleotidyltransferase [Candidatus Daviesbacteria bacterium]|nr:nucleotidyltransferase [Candidatus Daviesbacteria bacterium]